MPSGTKPSRPRGGYGPQAAIAVAAAAAVVPASYALLQRNYPTFWKDVEYAKTYAKLFAELRRTKNSGKTIVDMWEETAQNQPDHPCLLFEKEMYTYGEMRGNASRVARWIEAADPNLKKGDAVCFLLQNSPHFLWTWLGCLKKGIIASLLNFNLKPAALLECIRMSEAKKLVFGSEFLEEVELLLPELRAMNIELWMINDSGRTGLAPPVEVVTMDPSTMSGEPLPNVPMQLSEIAVYIFTSGTTGLPKPATVPHEKLFKGVFLHYFSDFTPDDVYYCALPLYHSAGLCVATLSAWHKGATVALAKKFSASHFWDDIRRYKATGFQYIGELCRYLLAQPKHIDDGKYPRRLRIAHGNGLRADIWEEFQSRFNIEKIIELYAATEGNNGFVNFDGKVGSIGRYPFIMQKLVDSVQFVEYDFATGEPIRGKDGLCKHVPLGQTGLTLFRIDTNFKYTGYKGSRDKSEKKLVKNVKKQGDVFFNTGDLMRLDEEYYVYFMDRIGDTFRWKGENVSTLEVAQVLTSYPAIMEANVYGVHIPGHDGRAGMAALVLNQGASLDLGSLYTHVQEALPDYACPKILRLMDQIEVTGTFKHKKTDLVKEGFNPDLVTDDLFIMDPATKSYVPLSDRHLTMLMAGHSKL